MSEVSAIKGCDLLNRQNVCRICYGSEEDETLLAPCKCSGSVQYIHETCLLTWLRSSAKHCEICKVQYQFSRKLKPSHKRLSPNISTWHLGCIIKELVFLDWFHFLETVFICISLIVINRMSSFDLVYQFALIGIVELLYYSLNIFSCFFLLYYEHWSLLNLELHVLNYNPIQRSNSLADDVGLIISAFENYASFLKKNRRLQTVIQRIKESDAHLQQM